MTDMQKLYDVIIIGGGPAGLTAALYLARARYRVLVLEKEHFGGQITITSEVVNFPGVERTSGTALTETMRKQAEAFGAEFLLAEATGLSLKGDIKTVTTSRGELKCFGLLLATGASPRMVGFRGEAEFKGHGVAYCATCDGEFFTGQEVFVVGGGFAAAEESVFLTKYASHVTILIRGDDFTCAKATADAARNHEKITVLTNTEVEEAAGDSVLRLLRYRNNVTGEISEYRPPEGQTFGIFVFAGYAPATELVRDMIELNEQGYMITDKSQKTSLPGVYAAGDVCIKPLRQVVTAVGDGALAATELEKVAAAAQRKTGLHPAAPRQSAAGDRPGTNSASGTGTGSDTGSNFAGSGSSADSDSDLFDAQMLSQLQTVFSRMETPLLLKVYTDDRPVSRDLEAYMKALAALTDKLSLQTITPEEKEADTAAAKLPFVQICRTDGTDTGLAFHGVPGGHEFTSFILGLYNASGPGQTIDEALREEIQAWNRPLRMQILVSLSCTMCPELVTAAQKAASLNPNISAEVYDLNHFPELRDRYHVLSVPCLILNEASVSFGKKNIRQLWDLISKEAL